MRHGVISIWCAKCNKPVDHFQYEQEAFDRNIATFRVVCHGMEESGAFSRAEIEQSRFRNTDLTFFAGSDPPARAE